MNKRVNYMGILAVIITLAALACVSCGQRKATNSTIAPFHQVPLADAVQGNMAWPGLPVDKAQPWEKLDSAGRVVSSINKQSEFIPGVERFQEAGSVSDLGEASTFASGAPGAEGVSWAIYRIPIGADQPGTIACDSNLRLNANSEMSAYYIGVGDYSVNTWHWYGPFSVSHVRFNVPTAAYTSGLGNLMLAVVAYDGADFDLVGLGVNVRDNADSTAPSAPAAPTLTPVAGGVLAEWITVVAADLAGYRVYADGNNVFDYIEGGTSIFIPATADVAITLSAVDVSGNESAQSTAANAAPLTGDIPVVELTASSVSGMRGDIISLSASGADSYDWDTNGDGTWDITGDTTGSAFAVTTDMGIIRPALRAHAAGDGFWMGAVSLIIGGNSRPVVCATAAPQSGVAPLAVNFTITAVDDDGTILQYVWDFDGDGIFDGTSAPDPSPLPFTYNTSGLYNAKFRAYDNEGSWDVDTVAINVTDVVTPPANQAPSAVLTASPRMAYLGDQGSASILLSTEGTIDADGDTLSYYFDPEGIGATGMIDNGTNGFLVYSYTQPGIYNATVYVTDDDIRYSQATVQVQILKLSAAVADSSFGAGYYNSIAEVNAHPAVAFFNGSANYLNYVRSTDPYGMYWGTVQTVDSTGVTGGFPSLCVVNEYPAIAYIYLSTGYIKFARASDKNGDIWGTPVTVDDTCFANTDLSMAIVNGRPAVAYVSTFSGILKYCRALDASGATWGAPVVPDLSMNVKGDASLVVSGGNPGIAYRLDVGGTDYVYYVSATDVNGDSWNPPVAVSSSVACDGHISCANVGGVPGVAWHDPASDGLVFCRALDSSGTAWGTPCPADSVSGVGKYNCLTVIKGSPAISYYDEAWGALRFVQASYIEGTSWMLPQSPDKSTHCGEYTSMAVVNGRLMIAYRDSDNSQLRVAAGAI